MAARRIGGIALLISNLVLYYTQKQFPVENFGFLLLAVLPAFGGGLVEDIKKDVGVASRLMLTMFAAALGAWMLGAVLPRVDSPGFDTWLRCSGARPLGSSPCFWGYARSMSACTCG